MLPSRIPFIGHQGAHSGDLLRDPGPQRERHHHCEWMRAAPSGCLARCAARLTCRLWHQLLTAPTTQTKRAANAGQLGTSTVARHPFPAHLNGAEVGGLGAGRAGGQGVGSGHDQGVVVLVQVDSSSSSCPESEASLSPCPHTSTQRLSLRSSQLPGWDTKPATQVSKNLTAGWIAGRWFASGATIHGKSLSHMATKCCQ